MERTFYQSRWQEKHRVLIEKVSEEQQAEEGEESRDDELNVEVSVTD